MIKGLVQHSDQYKDREMDKPWAASFSDFSCFQLRQSREEMGGRGLQCFFFISEEQTVCVIIVSGESQLVIHSHKL